jgi:hypothetical protein
MKIFISWSGLTSHSVAKVLREWLPSVKQSIVPYVSSEDIDKGTRWSSDIAGELNNSSFGILCVTKENISSPWLNFEAGALSKIVDKSRVCPILYKVKRSEISGPLLQFQSTIIEKMDVLKLLKTINNSCEDHTVDDSRIEKIFEVWWPQLQRDLDSIVDEIADVEKAKETQYATSVEIEKILEEVLELSRLNQKILRNPEELLPVRYMERILNTNDEQIKVLNDLLKTPAIDDMDDAFDKLYRMLEDLKINNANIKGLDKIEIVMRELGNPLKYIVRRFKPGRMGVV